MMNWIEPLFEGASRKILSNRVLFENTSSFFIYGTGTFARDVFQLLLKDGKHVLGFIDHHERNTAYFDGLPIYTSEQAAAVPEKDKIGVVLGIHNYQADLSKIISRLEMVGFKKLFTSVDIYDFWGRELGVRYWLTSRDYYFSLKTLLEETETLFADAKSRSIFRSIIEYRLTGDVTKLPEPDLDNPYHPTDLPSWRSPLRFVDCGAFDGDTLEDFVRNGFEIQAVAAFEPDLENFSKLSRFVQSHKKDFPDVTLFPCGVYSSTKQLSFETGQGMASNITGKNAAFIQCVALDDAICSFAPNLIKMDIEGAEYDALLGGRGLINACLPGLAISLYHRPEHLWQIPLLVNELAPNKYEFFIRSHAMSTFDSVLYCISK